MSLQGCPREVRLLLAGPYYYDVDMVNSLPNVARQLAGLGMVSAPNLQALHALCDGRDAVLGGIEAHYGLTGSPALGETARGVAKGLPIRLLHGGSHAAWLAAHGLAEEHPMLPLMVQLERELRGCRREVYRYMGRHDAAWLAKVEAHVREAKAGEALRRHGPGGGRARAAAAAAAREVWLLEKVEASVYARVLQDMEDRNLNCVRLVLQGEGWPARSWQQDGLLVEDMGGRQLRGGGGGGEPAVVRLEAAMRKAEAEVLAREKLEVGLLVKTFFDGPVEAVLQRMAGPGGRRPAAAEARGAAARARAAGVVGGGLRHLQPHQLDRLCRPRARKRCPCGSREPRVRRNRRPDQVGDRPRWDRRRDARHPDGRAIWLQRLHRAVRLAR